MLLHEQPYRQELLPSATYDRCRNWGHGGVGRESALDCGVVRIPQGGRMFFAALAFPAGSEGIAKMTKIAAAIVGAATTGGLLITLAPNFSADFALAVIACFS